MLANRCTKMTETPSLCSVVCPWSNREIDIQQTITVQCHPTFLSHSLLEIASSSPPSPPPYPNAHFLLAWRGRPKFTLLYEPSLTMVAIGTNLQTSTYVETVHDTAYPSLPTAPTAGGERNVQSLVCNHN